MESTREFVENLQEQQKKQQHNRSRAEGNPGGKLPNKRKGTMK